MENDSEPEVEENGGDTSSQKLDCPAATDLECPIEMKKAKINDQRQRRIRQYSESQASTSESVSTSLVSINSKVTSIWEMQDEADRRRALKEEERYNEMYEDMRRKRALENEFKMASHLTELVLLKTSAGEKLADALEKLDQIDPLSLANDNQRLMYEVRKTIVKNYEDLYEELGELLRCNKYQTPGLPLTKENVQSVGTSQRRIFDED